MISPIDSRGRPQHRDSEDVSFGGIADSLRQQVRVKYAAARANGHTVTPLIHSCFGGLEAEAVRFLSKLAKRVRAQAADSSEASAPSFDPFLLKHATSISLAVQEEVARQIHSNAAACGGAGAA